MGVSEKREQKMQIRLKPMHYMSDSMHLFFLRLLVDAHYIHFSLSFILPVHAMSVKILIHILAFQPHIHSHKHKDDEIETVRPKGIQIKMERL